MALLTTEAENIVVVEVGKERLWLQQFLRELRRDDIEQSIYCDSQSVIDMSKSMMHHARTKHIDVKYHWQRDAINKEELALKKIHSVRICQIC